MALAVEIMAPDSKVTTLDANYISVPGSDGLFGILKGHAPLLAELGCGEIRFERVDGNSERVSVKGGFLLVKKDKVLILADLNN
ncbi:MAG: F0F1 ATP synthase subunit epsilon [Fibrobacteres bacterium]|nr:F0F1 ATP synthase subunit epsilon [Fibrobacterota bacterium]